MSDDARTQNLAGSVRGGLAWSTLNSLALRAGSFALGIVLARLLTPNQFGVYAVALTVQAVLMTLADLGLSADLIRSEDPDRRAPTVGALGLASGLALAVTMAATAGPLARLLGSPGSSHVIAALSVTLVLAGAGVVPYAMLQRRFQQKTLLAIAAVDFVVSTTITVALIATGWGVMALAVGRIVGQAVTLVLQFVLSGTRPKYTVDRDQAGSVLRFGLPLAGANMLSWALLNIDNVVIARVAGTVALGYYVLAFNISNWPMSAIGQVVRSVALPTFSRLERRHGDPSLAIGTALTWAFALPAGAALAVLAAPLVNFVYGARWSPSVPVLAALGLFGALRVVFDLMASYLLARGASRQVLWVQLIWFAALVPAMILGTHWYGIAGGGWAHLVVAVVVILPAYLVAVRHTGADMRLLAAAFWPPLLAAIPAAAGGYAAAAFIDSPALALLSGAILGGALYGALLFPWLKRAIADTRTPNVVAVPATTDSEPLHDPSMITR